jgi:hypothetical protein
MASESLKPFRVSFDHEPGNPLGCVYWQVEQGYDAEGFPNISAGHSRSLVHALREAADALEEDLGLLGVGFGL